jgi:hypothetical protein
MKKKMRILHIKFYKSDGFEEIHELDFQSELLHFFEAQGYQAKVSENGFESVTTDWKEENER